ncbi:hypothetical protein [Gymnodinialimonas ulvae]|uniref:hypothetical protein n=1 Tax=Gymnodinialimonas ulvae TaxID=3126504 RepID=UPI0030996D14
MNTALPMLAIGLIFGGGIGFTIAASNGITLDGHDHSEHHGAMTHGDAEHAAAHEAILSLPDDADAPRLAVRIEQDPMSGWNLNIMAENFTFSPENASRDHVPGQGHAHVYIDGVKLGRFYGPWVHLDGLPEGSVDVRVGLFANDHRQLAVGDQLLSQTIAIEN